MKDEHDLCPICCLYREDIKELGQKLKQYNNLIEEIEKIILTTQHTYADGVKVIEIYSLIEKFRSDNNDEKKKI